jgi:hypothetical protein
MCPSSFEGDIALLVIIVIIWGGGYQIRDYGVRQDMI